jgi:hypothetical protein
MSEQAILFFSLADTQINRLCRIGLIPYQIANLAHEELISMLLNHFSPDEDLIWIQCKASEILDRDEKAMVA